MWRNRPRRERIQRAAVATTAVLLGCSSQPASPPPFHDTTADATPARPAYPEGPYGLGVGSTIPDLELMGYRDPVADAGGELVRMSLADFYNPRGHDDACHAATPDPDCLYASGSGDAAGKLKPTVLLVNVSAGWCGPCQDEAKNLFPQKHALYAPCGGELLLDLHDGVTPGPPATADDLTAWTTQYAVDYPAVIDPSRQLDPIFPSGFPNDVIIDTTTMKIVDVIVGELVVGTCSDVYVCSADADCALCLISGQCASGNPCTVDADCSAEKCSPLPEWTEYEARLDRSRTGCGLP